MSAYDDILNGVIDSGGAANLVEKLEFELAAAKDLALRVAAAECDTCGGLATAHECPSKVRVLEIDLGMARAAIKQLTGELSSLKEVLWATQFDAEQERKAKKITQAALVQLRKERDEMQIKLFGGEQ